MRVKGRFIGKKSVLREKERGLRGVNEARDEEDSLHTHYEFQ